MGLLLAVAVLLSAAAAWELTGARGEAGVARLRRRLDRGRDDGGSAILGRALRGEWQAAGRSGPRRTGTDRHCRRRESPRGHLAIPVAAAAAPVAPGRFGPFVLIGVPVAAFLAPDLLLERAARTRRAAVAAALPDALELMATGAAAGRGIGRLLEEAMRSSSGPLREELARAVAAIECGTSKEEALRSLASRQRQTELAGLASSLERSRRHGSPLSRTLHEQASSLRGEQRREDHRARRPGRAEDAARRRAPPRPVGAPDGRGRDRRELRLAAAVVLAALGSSRALQRRVAWRRRRPRRRAGRGPRRCRSGS